MKDKEISQLLGKMKDLEMVKRNMLVSLETLTQESEMYSHEVKKLRNEIAKMSVVEKDNHKEDLEIERNTKQVYNTLYIDLYGNLKRDIESLFMNLENKMTGRKENSSTTSHSEVNKKNIPKKQERPKSEQMNHNPDIERQTVTDKPAQSSKIITAPSKTYVNAAKVQNKSQSSEIGKRDLNQVVKRSSNMPDSEVGQFSTNVDSPGKNVDEDSAWTEVAYLRRRSSVHRIAARPKPIIGMAESTQLSAVESQACFFISGFSPNTSVEDVQKYLQESKQMSCKCEKLTTKSTLKSSFKLTVRKSLSTVILDPQTWPKGIIINFFLHLRRHPPPSAENQPTVT
nr:unnamed protein product [Callosobruchus analis]